MIELEYNDAQVSAALQELFDQLGDVSSIMSEIGDQLVVSTQKRMNEEVSPEGAAWAPRSSTTAEAYERKARKSDGPASWGGILTYSGQMGRRLKHEFGADFVVIGSPEPYAAVMQFGAAQGAFGAFIGKDKQGRDHFHHIPWGDIPARPFLGVSEDDRNAILDIVHEALARALGGA